MASNKEKLIRNLENTKADTLKDWLIDQIRCYVNEVDIKEGSDNGYFDGETVVEDFFVGTFMFFKPTKDSLVQREDNKQ